VMRTKTNVLTAWKRNWMIGTGLCLVSAGIMVAGCLGPSPTTPTAEAPTVRTEPLPTLPTAPAPVATAPAPAPVAAQPAPVVVQPAPVVVQPAPTHPIVNPSSPIPVPVQNTAATIAQTAQDLTGYPIVPLVSMLGNLITGVMLVVKGKQNKSLQADNKRKADAMNDLHAIIPEGATKLLPVGSTAHATFSEVTGV
jgi:hypothetical protein